MTTPIDLLFKALEQSYRELEIEENVSTEFREADGSSIAIGPTVVENVRGAMADAAPWMIVMLDNGVYQLASTQSVPREALHPGSVVMVSDCDGETRAAKIVALSNDRNTVEDQMHSLENNDQKSRVALEIINDPEPEDYSSSGSSWAPDQHSSSESESELPLKKIKTEPTKKFSKQKRKKKQQRPALRPEPVLPRCWSPSRLLNENSERHIYDFSKQSHNSTKLLHKQGKPSPSFDDRGRKINKENNQVALIELSEISTIKGEMELIRDIVQKLKTLSNNLVRIVSNTSDVRSFHSQSPVISNYSMEVLTPDMIYHDNGKLMNEHDQETPVITTPVQNRPLNYAKKARRSDSYGEFKMQQKKESNVQSDNTSEKKHKSAKKKNMIHNSSSSVGSELKEMVPIGSGKTLVPNEIYSKINWKSYTMATRKLLMAVFSRRTLATHSLTGKASPAFLSKPAKLCLDPKKVADIVMTVTANCHVKEGLVRSAITTKCADENKMLKLQTQKDQRQRTLEANVRSKDSRENTDDPSKG